MKTTWSLGKKIRYSFFVLANGIFYGFGFAYPSERNEFNKELDKNFDTLD